jgi:peptide/nickel transport system permease protein
MRNKIQLPALIFLLACIHGLILFAGFFAPYDAKAQDRNLPYAPPTKLHFRDMSGFHFRPFVYALDADVDSYREDSTIEYPLHFFVRGSPYSVLGVLHSDLHLFGVQAPARVMLIGSDAFGRDELSRLLVGGQISLAAGLLATLITLAAAAWIGVVSGYYGGWIDESLMGLAELFLSLPWLFFLLGVRAFLPLHVSPQGTFLLLIGVIGFLGWARPARLVRGVVLSARNRNYVSAASGFGASDIYILARHILPQTYGVLLTQAALLIPLYIAAEAALSFFGLGISEPVPSWGNMMASLQHYGVLVSYRWLSAPAVALVITTVTYGMLADVLHSSVKSNSI